MKAKAVALILLSFLVILTASQGWTKDDYPKVADQIFLVNKDQPVKTLPEIVTYAKQHPKTLSYGTAGVGTVPHLVMEMFNSQMQVDIQHIPYNSELQAVTALVGGHVQVSVLTGRNWKKWSTRLIS